MVPMFQKPELPWYLRLITFARPDARLLVLRWKGKPGHNQEKISSSNNSGLEHDCPIIVRSQTTAFRASPAPGPGLMEQHLGSFLPYIWRISTASMS